METDVRRGFGKFFRLVVLLTTVSAVVFSLSIGCGRRAPPAKPPSVEESAKQDGEPQTKVPEKSARETESSAASSAANSDVTVPPSEVAPVGLSPEAGKQLYALHCAACHGERGDGRGIAAAFLFPKPRDFRAGRFRLVSTKNNVPTREDLESVLQRGMPGSSMPPWKHLSPEQRQALVEEIMRFRREGARDTYVAVLKQEDELTDAQIAGEDVQAEIADYVTRFSTPGESVEVPAIGEPTAEAIVRGKELYISQSCHSCHGAEGKGDGVQRQFDDEGYPTQPRDYTIGIFKGGHDPASLYRRIAYGMPGTPMPASAKMTPEEMIDVVHFIRSLSTEEQRQAAILVREKIVAKAVAALPESADSDAWSAAEEVAIRTTPLWWRNDADVDLRVRAVHDGKSLAVRISWRDGTEDSNAVRTESFKDAAALEFHGGDAEPFIGMGDPNTPIDVWFWDADRQGTPLAVEDMYPNSVVDLYPFSETVVASAELNREGARTADQPEISLPARASGNAIVPSGGPSGASSLTAGGPGSVTFRIPQSQLVDARGQWKEGRWTVVMTRSLAVESAEDGISLEPASRASVAFAVWDGSHQDRDGKKLITIWQDLELQ